MEQRELTARGQERDADQIEASIIEDEAEWEGPRLAAGRASHRSTCHHQTELRGNAMDHAAAELLAIIASPDRHATLVGELKAKTAAAEEGAAALVVELETFDASARDTAAALASEKDALLGRHVAAVTKTNALEPRRARLAELRAAWVNIGENDHVVRGLQSPQFDPLTKALAAFGQLSEPGRSRTRE